MMHGNSSTRVKLVKAGNEYIQCVYAMFPFNKYVIYIVEIGTRFYQR